MTDNLKLLPPPEKKVVKTQSKDLTDKKEFSPTPAMRIWLETAVEMVSDSPKAIAEASQLSRAVWYEWLKIDGFEDWYYENYRKQRRRWLPTLDSIGMKNARRDYNFWKDMNKKAGENLEEKETFAGELTKDGARFVITRGED